MNHKSSFNLCKLNGNGISNKFLLMRLKMNEKKEEIKTIKKVFSCLFQVILEVIEDFENNSSNLDSNSNFNYMNTLNLSFDTFNPEEEEKEVVENEKAKRGENESKNFSSSPNISMLNENLNPFCINSYIKKEKKKENIIKSIENEVFNFILNTKLEISTVIIAFIYIDRIIKKQMELLDIDSLYYLLITSLILAQKYNEDVFFSDKMYCNASGITKIKFLTLIHYYVKKIDYRLYVCQVTYNEYSQKLPKFL